MTSLGLLNPSSWPPLAHIQRLSQVVQTFRVQLLHCTFSAAGDIDIVYARSWIYCTAIKGFIATCTSLGIKVYHPWCKMDSACENACFLVSFRIAATRFVWSSGRNHLSSVWCGYREMWGPTQHQVVSWIFSDLCLQRDGRHSSIWRRLHGAVSTGCILHAIPGCFLTPCLTKLQGRRYIVIL